MTLLGVLAAALFAACSSGDEERRTEAPQPAPVADPLARIRSSTAAVDDARLVAAADDPANWLTYGGTYAEQRFSPLTEIEADNVVAARPGLELRDGAEPRPRSDAHRGRRRALRERPLERGLGHRRAHRQGHLDP